MTNLSKTFGSGLSPIDNNILASDKWSFFWRQVKYSVANIFRHTWKISSESVQLFFVSNIQIDIMNNGPKSSDLHNYAY